MPNIEYVSKKFNADHTSIIELANSIIEEYARQGYDLTLRQLYYQFVARDKLANTQQNYKRLGGIISDARRAGLLDWSRIVDRTRFLRKVSAWDGPASIVAACADQFNVDFWLDQLYRPEVWVEKDALIGVVEVACEPWRVPYFSCRGYASDSEIWSSAQRLGKWVRGGQKAIVFHLGDHDPSGIDMSRDIEERLELFDGLMKGKIIVKRIALNMSQVEEHQPPPNPAKETDSRFAKYLDEYGDESWELDALSPTTLGELVADEMKAIIDKDLWSASERLRDEGREKLRDAAARLEDEK